jgi:hypothetical protein
MNIPKVYVLIATHHGPAQTVVDPTNTNIVNGQSVWEDSACDCGCTTTVCGVFTSLELARLAKANECRRWGLRSHRHRTSSKQSEHERRPLHYSCRSDGSYRTSFQIAEREIWAFPHAQQPIVYNRAAEQHQHHHDHRHHQKQSSSYSWMTGGKETNHPHHQAPVNINININNDTTTTMDDTKNSILHSPVVMIPFVSSNATSDHGGNTVDIGSIQEDKSGIQEEQGGEKKMEE